MGEVAVADRVDVLAEVVPSVGEHVAELIVIFDATGTALWANGQVRRILGYEPCDWVGHHAVEFAHPDDIALGMELLSSAKATGAGVKEPVTYRLRHADGRWVDLECVASNVATDQGLLLVVSGRPAGVQRPPGGIFAEASSRVAAMFDDAAIGMAQVGLDGTVLRANRRLESWTGSTAATLVGAPLGFLSVGELVELAASLDEDGLGQQTDALIDVGGGDSRHVRVSASLVGSHLGDPLYYAVQVVDVTELIRAEAELVHRARHDPLTGLANRAVLDELFDGSEVGEVAVIYLDLDGFKGVNDVHGHAAGDEVLCAISERLRSAVRAVDVVVRLGGDEFVVACDEITTEDAVEMAGRLVRACALPVTLSTGVEVSVGASAGVAADRERRLGDLLRRADRLLYDAKASGGGRVVLTNDGAPLAGVSR